MNGLDRQAGASPASSVVEFGGVRRRCIVGSTRRRECLTREVSRIGSPVWQFNSLELIRAHTSERRVARL